MEGIGGISHPKPTERGDMGYPEAVELMTGEANAAIEGALAGGATEVLVNDSHGFMYNLAREALHPAARLVQGQKAWSMVEGAGPDGGIDVALFVGYHARAGDPKGTLAHTYSFGPCYSAVNGQPAGETTINAACLGAWGVPVGMVSGDDRLALEVAAWLPWAERVVVKEGVGRHAAASLHPSTARALVRDGAERAVRRAAAGELRPLRLDSPVTIEIAYRHAGLADHAAIVPGAERVGDTTVRHTADDAVTAYRGFLAGVRLSGLVE
jgi:D-amino peptidase